MIFLKIWLDNIYMFKDATLDLTYSRKIKNSPIPYEFIEDYPKINFKRVCILTGANASGKTVLGKTLCVISNYLAGRDINNEKGGILNITSQIFDTKKPGSFVVEFVTPENGLFHHISVSIDEEGLVEEDYRNLIIRKSYNYNDLVSRIFAAPKCRSHYHRKSNNHGVKSPGFRSYAASIDELSLSHLCWNYCFTGYNDTPLKPTSTRTALLERVMKSFDPSIRSVKRIKGSEKDSFLIKFSNKDEALISDGELQDANRFSRGTLESLELASFFQWLEQNDSGTFFLDEKMAYSHSLVEQTILNLFIEILGKQAQFFFTTHNLDILNMNLPVHSFTFLRKELFSQIIHPEKIGFTNKNDRSLAGFVRNDVFNTLPSTELLNELL